MNQSHLTRTVIILLFILVAVTFIAGTLHTFIPARAVSNATETPTPTPASATASIALADSESQPADSAPEQVYVSDMTGIIALSIVMVAVILIGVAWGSPGLRRKKNPKE